MEMIKNTWIVPLFLILAGQLSFAQETNQASNPSSDLIKITDRSKVCMVTNRLFETTQIPVKVGKNTYYGCCEMCKKTLSTEPNARASVDPISGKKIDKAKAIIGATSSGDIVYFESEKNLKSYRSKN